MKKKRKIIIFIIIFILLIAFIIIDSLIALKYNQSPLLKRTIYYADSKISKENRGLLVITYYYEDNSKKTRFRWDKNIDEKLLEESIAVFHGGGAELFYETYLYEFKINNKTNYFYINVQSNTTSWGSSKIKRTITKQGNIKSKEKIFKIAEKNNAYSYVTLKDDDKVYKIEEFRQIFLEESID